MALRTVEAESDADGNRTAVTNPKGPRESLGVSELRFGDANGLNPIASTNDDWRYGRG